jgi:hypothetical protein|tara:strand:- start:427 stop:786 length:360 start_codon:yes stop_codon:yes gene_type:complete
MKKILFLLAFAFIGTQAYSQSVNGTPIEDIEAEYIQIVGYSKLLSNKVTIMIDFGQSTKFFNSGKEKVVKDENGNLVKFNSMIDALNFMSKNGYEFQTAYAFAIGNQNVYHYLLKKRTL